MARICARTVARETKSCSAIAVADRPGHQVTKNFTLAMGEKIEYGQGLSFGPFQESQRMS